MILAHNGGIVIAVNESPAESMNFQVKYIVHYATHTVDRSTSFTSFAQKGIPMN